MKIIDSLNDWLESKERLMKENDNIKTGKKKVEKKFQEIETTLEEIQKKYTELLEEKSVKFDLFVEYQEQCKKLAEERRALKRELAQKEEVINELSAESLKQEKRAKLAEKKLEKITKVEEKPIVASESDGVTE